jgi:uncharacterized protein (TIGR00645 family)
MIEKKFEKLMYASRWVLAPIYLGLSLGLFLLGIKFFQEVIHTVPLILSMKESGLVLMILSLVDMALVGGLIVMVMFSGYENFVSRLNIDDGDEKLSWLGKLDASSLKQKVAASIVAISSIHLLKIFMAMEEQVGTEFSEMKIKWFVIVHLTFVLSALGMAWVDKINRK